MSDGSARIYEQGYRRYEGTRLGVSASIRSLVLHSIRRGLGLRRTFWAKLLPIATVVIAYVPAAVFVGIAAIIPEEFTDQLDSIPSYADYFGNITAAILLFVAVVGPEVLCSDRKNGMLGMYLASPLTRETYLLSKVLAVLPVLLLVTLGPQILLLIGRTLVDAGPETVGDFALVAVRTLAAGLVVSATYTAISLAAASLTDRRAFASAGVILTLLISSAVTSALVEGADVDRRLYLLNLGFLPIELVYRIYGEAGSEPSLTTASLVAATLAWILGSAALVLWRYRKLTVDAMTVIEVNNVTKWFADVVAVSEVTFDLDVGVTALLGPNGAGKSTMLRLLCGLTRPSQGTVRMFGEDPNDNPPMYRRLGLVPQQEAMFETMTGRRFVQLAATLHTLPDPRHAAEAALRVVELDPEDRRPLRTYSKGMRQRLKVAQAIVHDPEIVVLDEPLEGLDPRQRLHLIELFRRLGDEGRCVLVSSHVLDEVERFGSRVLVMSNGRLAAEGDFHAIRDLMDDRPHRVRLRTDKPHELAGELLASRSIVGAHVESADGLVVDTIDASSLRADVAPAAQRAGAHLFEVVPLDDDLESVFRYLVTR